MPFWMALWVSLVTLFLALLAWFTYDRTLGGFQFVEEREWLSRFGVKLSTRCRWNFLALCRVVSSVDSDCDCRQPHDPRTRPYLYDFILGTRNFNDRLVLCFRSIPVLYLL